METRAAFDKFVSWYTFEKQFSATSWDNLEAVQSRLKENIEPAFQLKQLNLFATVPPFKGRVWDGGGLIRYSVKPLRNLRYSLNESPTGTRLDGTLELRGRRYIILIPAIYSCLLLFGVSSRSIPMNGLPQVLICSVVLLALVRLNLAISIWLNRSSEARFLAWVDTAIQPAKIPFPSPPAIFPVAVPTSTEVLVRPKHELPRP